MKIEDLKVGDRVRMLSGSEAVVIKLLPLSEQEDTYSDDRVELQYSWSSKRDWAYVQNILGVILPVPEKPEPEPINPGDRVRHNSKVHSEYRRLGGKVLSVGGTYALVQWDGFNHERKELLSQLELVHRAETKTKTKTKIINSSMTIEQALELLRAEYRATADKVEELQAYQKSLVAAVDTLSGVVS